MSKNVLEDRNQFINTSDALNELNTDEEINIINWGNLDGQLNFCL